MALSAEKDRDRVASRLSRNDAQVQEPRNCSNSWPRRSDSQSAIAVLLDSMGAFPDPGLYPAGALSQV